MGRQKKKSRGALPGLGKSREEKLTARAELEAVAFRLVARHLALGMELGNMLIRIKSTLRHNSWKAYFAETFAGSGIRLSTAQLWMDLAHASTNDNITMFEPAMDAQAVKIRRATALAQAQAGQKPKRRSGSSDTFDHKHAAADGTNE